MEGQLSRNLKQEEHRFKAHLKNVIRFCFKRKSKERPWGTAQQKTVAGQLVSFNWIKKFL